MEQRLTSSTVVAGSPPMHRQLLAENSLTRPILHAHLQAVWNKEPSAAASMQQKDLWSCGSVNQCTCTFETRERAVLVTYLILLTPLFWLVQQIHGLPTSGSNRNNTLTVMQHCNSDKSQRCWNQLSFAAWYWVPLLQLQGCLPFKQQPSEDRLPRVRVWALV